MTRAVIAEDEALLRQSLVELLRDAWPELEIAAECEDGASALDAIAEHQPDVAFLDIRMPGLNGLEVASGAIDYLLKPIERERLAATVEQDRQRLGVDRAGVGRLAGRAVLQALRQHVAQSRQ